MGTIHNPRGLSVLMALLSLIFLGGVAATTLTVVSTGQEQRASETASEQAYGLAQAGIEYAKNRIDQGMNPVGQHVPFGPGTFSITADPNTGQLVVVGQVGTARRTHTLTTPFAKQCVDLDVSHAHSASRNIVGMKLKKTCLSKATVTDWTLTWNPVVAATERTVRLQVTGEQLATLYDYPSGYESGRKIDATDFTLIRNTGLYPVNKVEFANTILAGKTYTVSLHLGDGSIVTKSFLDPGPTAADMPPPPPGGTGITVSPNGDVAIAPNKTVAVDALCSEITMGAGGAKIPVKAWLQSARGNGPVSEQPLFGGNAVAGGEHFVASSGPQGTTYGVKAKAALGSFQYACDSKNTRQVKVLTNGGLPPPLAGFGGQKPVSACIKPFLNRTTGKVMLYPNQVLLLFELGVQMTTSLNHPAADFQDLVVLLTVD